MDSYSTSTLPSSSPHHPVDAYPNLNIINSFPNHTTSTATLAPPPHRNDDHPSYSKMICSAIRALEEKNGSSKKAIGKYMEQEYKDLLPTNHDTLLTQNLKYLTDKNILIMVKRSYKFPDARSDKPMSFSLASPSFVPRGYDCPPKPNPDSKSAPQLEQNAEPKSTQLGLNDVGESNSSVVGATTEMTKTSHDGQSLKVSGEGVSSTLRLENGKRVRRPPARYQSFSTVEIISNDHKRKRGRPSKAHMKPAARSDDGCVPPPADAHVLAQSPSNSIPIRSPKPKGRPKKNVVASPSIAGGGKKPAVARKPMKKSMGKPVGSPKGSQVAIENNQEEIEADLKEKFQYIQSRVRRTVAVLRTYFNLKSPVMARAAIHLLQNLSSLDLEMPLLREDRPGALLIRNASNRPPMQTVFIRRPTASMIFGHLRFPE
ncbi:unnamed protein product [Lupinus luteus]|uniref:H15 domain-containing protein n=1 Tax=Lupinus luteus TaxID=3873 RepID=A0AAV1YAT9_LUPLU